jgi:hypothetical protein
MIIEYMAKRKLAKSFILDSSSLTRYFIYSDPTGSIEEREEKNRDKGRRHQIKSDQIESDDQYSVACVSLSHFVRKYDDATINKLGHLSHH